MKKFSIIVPVYKVEKYITQTIESLCNQTFTDFELIIVDDGSPDQSAIIAEKILSASDVNYQIVHTENRGVSAARNTGIDLATGQFIIMVDGDDVLAPDFLSVYDGLIRKQPDGDVYSTSFTVYKGNEIIEQSKLEEDVVVYSAIDAMIAFFNRNPRFLLPTLMFSNDYLKQNRLKFDEHVRYSEDVQFIWRALAYNKKHLTHSTYSGYKYILHPGSTMTASGAAKILTWCNGFESLYKEIHFMLPEKIRDSLAPVSYFSMLHGISKMLPYSSFKEVYEKSNSKDHLFFRGAVAPSKVKFVSRLIRKCPYLGYKILKKY